MKLYFDSTTEAAPEVIDGPPPVDNSAALTAAVAALNLANAKLAAMQSAINAVKARAQARKDADAAKVDGQDDLDALSAF